MTGCRWCEADGPQGCPTHYRSSDTRQAIALLIFLSVAALLFVAVTLLLYVGARA